MKSRVAVLVFIVSAGFTEPAEAGPPSGDLAKLAGEWRAVIRPTTDRWYTLQVKGEQVLLTTTLPGVADDIFLLAARGVLDEKADPKRWDWVDVQAFSGEGSKKSPIMPSIYKLEGTTLTMCIGGIDGPRPTDFQGEANRGDINAPIYGKRSLLVFERRGQVASFRFNMGSPVEEAKRFAGHWKIHRVEIDGAVSEQEDDPLCWLKLSGDALEFVQGSFVAGREEKGSFKIVGVRAGYCEVDAKVIVKSGGDLGKGTTQEVTSKELWRLIDKDTLQRCFWGGDDSERSRERPETFSTKAGDKWIVLTFKRAKA